MTTSPDTKPEKVKRKKSVPPPAPIGNQYAVGNCGGRPPKYDLEKEAAELLEWCKKPDSTAIYKFTRDKDYLADELDEFADRSPVFALAYKKAKEIVGQNREDLCNAGAIREGVWARSAAIYHSKLDKFERDKKEFEAGLNAKKDQNQSFEEMARAIAEGVCRGQKS